VRLRELLDPPCALVPLTDQAALERELRGVVTTDLPDPSKYLHGGELVVTGLIWRKESGDAERFVAATAQAGVSALAAGTADDDDLPADLLDACRKHRLPLLRVPADLAFATLTEHVVRRISGQRASDLGSLLERHRRLVTAPDPAQALGAILELISADLGMPCRVLDARGETVADGGEPLAEAERRAIARAALSATSLPARAIARRRAENDTCDTADKNNYRSIFTVDNEDRITDWYLVLDGDWRQWDPQRRSVVDQVVVVLAAERARLRERSIGWRTDAERLVRDLAAGTMGPGLTARMAELGVHCGTGAAEPRVAYRALAVAVSDPKARPEDFLEAAFSVSASIPGPSHPAAAVPALPGLPALIARFDDDQVTGLPAHAVALVAEHGDEAKAEAHFRDWLDQVAPGLGLRRVGVGISNQAGGDPVPLKRAIDDARHALRVAVAKPEPVAFVGQSDIASHALLLASVPEEVRGSYRDRMLGPIREYDHEHNAELEATLEAFLRASGSWIKCAAAMHLHVNTLRYRISRIEELVGRPLSLLETQADLLLALNLR